MIPLHWSDLIQETLSESSAGKGRETEGGGGDWGGGVEKS